MLIIVAPLVGSESIAVGTVNTEPVSSGFSILSNQLSQRPLSEFGQSSRIPSPQSSPGIK